MKLTPGHGMNPKPGGGVDANRASNRRFVNGSGGEGVSRQRESRDGFPGGDIPVSGARCSRSGQGTHRARLLAMFVGGACVMLTAFAGGALASAPTFKALFTCSTEKPCGEFTSIAPGPVAVDETTGNVYAVDFEHDAIDVFSQEGAYLTQILGSSVKPGETFGWNTQADIAVDNSKPGTPGRVYVETGMGGDSYYAFEPEAGNKYKFLWGKKVSNEQLCGIGVDPAGMPWYDDMAEGLQAVSPADGTPAGPAILNTGSSCHFAFEQNSDIVLEIFFGPAQEYDPTGTKVLVRSYRPGLSYEDVAVDSLTGFVYTSLVLDGVYFWTEAGAASPSSPLAFSSTQGAGLAVDGSRRELYVGSVATETEPAGIASFDLPTPYKLTTSTAGRGTGSVTCNGSPCSTQYDNKETVRLEALPVEGSAFTGWTVNGSEATCPGTGACELTLGEDTTVQASFDLIEHELTVSESGPGEVASVPAAVACGATCKASLLEGEFLVLTAVPAAHYHLVGWSGCDEVEVGECYVTMSSDKSVSARFAPTMRKLTVGLAGAGSGSVSCQVGVGPAGPCAAEYEDGTVLTLSAAAMSGSTFAGFSGGGCSGTAPCVLTLNGDTAVTATFDLVPVEKPAEKPAEKPVEVPTEKPAGKPTVKHLTRGQLLAAAIKKCRKLPKRRRATCVKRARMKYAPSRHRKRK